MNRLRNESSPYLRQHAANPVDWYPWGEEALARARREDRPILVSIGYSTCHWCHVMERESFEDADIAAYMNAHLVSIKVDREERPDLDQLYMEACEILTGQGGWPLNVFLTPQGRPFYAGTYFPPEAAGRRLSWSQALQYVVYNFRENRPAVERQADRVQERLRQAERGAITPPEAAPAGEADRPAAAWEHLRRQYDEEAGGFGAAPKFPNLPALDFLLHYAWQREQEAPLRLVTGTLDHMLGGGIYDQLGGGLARYAVDRYWRVPHFEKMLYDNALFVRLLADVYRRTREERYARAIAGTLAFVDRELTSPEGAFYAALDADTAGEEGAYYTWTRQEVEEVLGADAGLFCRYYGITTGGNREEKHILWRPRSLADLAREQGLDPAAAADRLAAGRRRLLARRDQRPRPHRDEKIVLGWNALMVSAYAHAGHALGREDYREAARRGLRFLVDHLTDPATGALHRVFLDGQASQPAFLSDYALLIEARLDAYSLDYSTDHLRHAAALTEEVLARFSDEEERLFYYSPSDGDRLFLRRRDLVDGETPAGNALMAFHLQRLGLLLDRPGWRRRAARMLTAMRQAAVDDPLAYAGWWRPLLAEEAGLAEIAITGPGALAFAGRIQSQFLPHHVLMAATGGAGDFPLLAGRDTGPATRIYLCRDYTCRRPVESVEAFVELLNEGRGRQLAVDG